MLGRLSTGQFWRLWVLGLALVTGCLTLVMDTAPFLHKDEFLIVELGRIFLNPHTDWSIAWSVVDDKPVVFPWYLGPVLQEAAYQLLGAHGPRLSALFGALLAATFIVLWLLQKGINKPAAGILGFVFLLDPIFVQAYGLARVDSWMMAAIIAAGWLIAGIKTSDAAAKQVLSLFLAGVLCAVAFFIWPTAIFLYPLVLFEIYELYKRCRFSIEVEVKRAYLLFGAVFGAAAAGLILVTPVYKQIIHNLIDSEGFRSNIGGNDFVSKGLSFKYSFAQFLEMFRVFKFTPALFLLTVYSACKYQYKSLIAASLICAALLIGTNVYIHRVQYLLPYCILFIGLNFSAAKAGYQPWFRVPVLPNALVLGSLIFWAVGLSLVIRSYLAMDQPGERSRGLIYSIANSIVGPGRHHVFSTMEFYYPGRELGWKMFIGYADTLSVKGFRPILDHVDYVVMHQYALREDLVRLITEKGMMNMGTMYLYSKESVVDNKKMTNIGRIRNLFSIPRKPYGPYQVFVTKDQYSYQQNRFPDKQHLNKADKTMQGANWIMPD